MSSLYAFLAIYAWGSHSSPVYPDLTDSFAFVRSTTRRSTYLFHNATTLNDAGQSGTTHSQAQACYSGL